MPPAHDEQGNSLDQIATDTQEGACWHEVFAVAAYLADRQIEDTALVNVSQAIGNQSPIYKIGLRMSSKLLGTGMREGVDAAAKTLAPVIADSCATEGNPFLDAGKLGRLYDLTQSSVLMQITYYG